MHLFPFQIYNKNLQTSLFLQDHKVFAHHAKFGTFEVPKEFLNTNQKAPAAVSLKAVRQARAPGMHVPSLAPSLARHVSLSPHG